MFEDILFFCCVWWQSVSLVLVHTGVGMKTLPSNIKHGSSAANEKSMKDCLFWLLGHD